MWFLLATVAVAAEFPDLSSVSPDLHTPVAELGSPARGKRVYQTTAGWENTEVHHTLYLPTNRRWAGRYPVLVEYAGNGGYTNRFGDKSYGVVGGSNLGYGISGGKDFIWLCLPYVSTNGGRLANAPLWWGSPDETVRYCTNTVLDVCRRYGGDSNAIIFCGFSRGAIGANYIGLHDDGIAPLWRGFITFSHYDGQRTNWPYAGADRASAQVRLDRLKGRPQFISAEQDVTYISDYLKGTGVAGNFTFVPIPYRNHSDEWVLRDIPERRQVRDWVKRVLKPRK